MGFHRVSRASRACGSSRIYRFSSDHGFLGFRLTGLPGGSLVLTGRVVSTLKEGYEEGLQMSFPSWDSCHQKGILFRGLH